VLLPSRRERRSAPNAKLTEILTAYKSTVKC
jgi:hypothetical protein